MSGETLSRPVVTRIAPSPTGFMHIGTARTALFNWLYARGRGGKFLLRIEDTDRARSTPEATQAILDGMRWLGLDWDGEAVSQFARRDRHAEVAHEMLARGAAYKCFASQAEIEAARAEAEAQKRSTIFRSPWRDADPATHPDAPFAIRVKAPLTGETVIEDRVQGRVRVPNDTLDDMVILRSDGTPTYMLAVVVDDHDAGVSHVIRGDDHLTNAARQQMVYDAMGWELPVWAHIPLIYGPDGKKLSKRHGATGVAEYEALGYPAPGMRNYLTRLGWAHGDAEVFSTDEALAWFDLSGIGRAPARLDFRKLDHVCGQHIAAMDDAALVRGVESYLSAAGHPALTGAQRALMERGMFCLKDRAKTYVELVDKASFLMISRPVRPDAAASLLLDATACRMLAELTRRLQAASWTKADLTEAVTQAAQDRGLGFGKIAAPLRAALAGRTVTPGVVDMMLVLGRDETVVRLADASDAAPLATGADGRTPGADAP